MPLPLHLREQPSGARLYGARARLTPERELFEWALLDVNKSGTAEAMLSSLALAQRRGLFLLDFANYGKIVSVQYF